MTKARSVVDVLLGEAVYGSPAQRYADMRAIASTIQNRARFTNSTPEEVVGNTREFNAFGRSLPAGVETWRGLAQRAWDDVVANGPVHDGRFYATPGATGNLPNGLQQVHSTTGHLYFADPKNRAIGTSLGYRGQAQPSAGQQAIENLLNAPTPTDRPPDIQGILSAQPVNAAPLTPVERAPLKDVEMPKTQFDMARFGEPAPQGLFDASRFGPKTATAADMNQLRRGLLDQQLQAGILPSLAQPAYAAMAAPQQQPAQTAYVDPAVTTQAQPAAFEAQPAVAQGQGMVPMEVRNGLLSGPEYEAVQAQRQYLASQPFNGKSKKLGNAAKKVAATIGGALLGGMVAGPLGGLLGGYMGPRVIQPGGLLGGKFPAAPQSQSQGNGQLNEYGHSVEDSSQQFRDAMSRGGIGLY